MERCCLFLQVSTRDFEYADLQEVLSDLEPFRITWDYKRPETVKVKTDKKNSKSKKIMALLSKKKQ
jgi:hypothetical protein